VSPLGGEKYEQGQSKEGRKRAGMLRRAEKKDMNHKMKRTGTKTKKRERKSAFVPN